MRILLVPSSYPPVLGGLQTVAHTLAGHLRERHTVQVVTKRYPRSLPSQELSDGVGIQRLLFLTPDTADLRRGRPDLFVAACYFCPSTLVRLHRLMRTFRPDVVNVHFPDSQAPFVSWLRRRFAFRLVVSLHGNEIERWFNVQPKAGDRQPAVAERTRRSAITKIQSILQEADAVTACSHYLLDKAIQLEPSVAQKGQVIYNGVDLDRFRDKTAFAHSRPYILAFGRLTHKKGFDMLLEAFGPLAPHYPGVDLILAGDGEERQVLQAHIERLGLGARVHLFGRASPQEIVQLLNGCLFVVVPSREEPFGIAALEALAAGKPILATRVGGLVELIKGSGTCLVAPQVSDIQKGLAQWIDSLTTKRAGSLAFTSETYSWSRVVAQFERVYRGEITS